MQTLSASPTAPGAITTTPTVTPQACPPGYTLTSRGCLKAGSFAPSLTTNVPQPTRPPLCPAPWMIATSVGCLYPAGTITAFDARRGKWRVAVAFEALRPPPLPTPGVPPRTLTPMTPMTPASTLTPQAAMTATRSGFGAYMFGQAATHQSVAEADAPPQGVKQVDIATFTIAVGEPVPSQSTPPSPLPLPPAPSTSTTPPRVDVGPTTVPSSGGSPPFVPPQFPGSQFPGSQFPTTRPKFTGCIARFNKSRRVYSIYCPIGTVAASPGLGIASDDFRCLYGNCNGLGQAVTPAVPAGFVKTAETATLPGAGETAAGEERDNFFRANNPAMWITIVGTVAAVGGGGYWLMRRRRKAA